MNVGDLVGAEAGKTALLVAGGPSGSRWRDVAAAVSPDIIITVNGSIRELGAAADYWICLEMDMGIGDWYKDYYPETKGRIINAQRHASDFSSRPDYIPAAKSDKELSFRGYAHGFWMGLNYPRQPNLGTGALFGIHLAGLLGCRAVHTVGMDLTVGDGPDHWYTERNYCDEDSWRNDKVEVCGKRTIMWFYNSAGYLLKLRPLMAKENLAWYDHSNGLLQALGMPNG